MLTSLKSRLRGFIRNAVAIPPCPEPIDHRWSAANKVAQQNFLLHFRGLAHQGKPVSLDGVGFRVFSQFEEDGLLLAIFGLIGTSNRTFIDLGSWDGVNSNCANLAINHGWRGLFVDGNPDRINSGADFYRDHPDTWLYPPQFKNAFIQRENINELLKEMGFTGEVDLLNLDIDGNDYWVWDALTAVSPRVVIIETHIEFGMEPIVVPYDKDYFYPGKHPDYHGASPVAMKKLANSKGYRLVGCSNYGFNTIYVRNGIGEDVLPEIPVEKVFEHPRNIERMKLFEPIKDWEYQRV